MNFQETIYELAKQTEEIEVCACGGWSEDNEKDIGIRSGSANGNVEFHDPIIDNTVFMICGNAFNKWTYRRERLIDCIDDFGLDDYIIRLKAVGGNPPYISTIMLGDYKIESIEQVPCHKSYSAEKVLKLKLKRING